MKPRGLALAAGACAALLAAALLLRPWNRIHHIRAVATVQGIPGSGAM